MRGFMAAAAGADEPSQVSWLGTFAIILPISAVVGGLLGWAEHLRRTGDPRRLRRTRFAPLLFTVDPASLVVTLPALAGGYALSGRGSRRKRWILGGCALLPVPTFFAAVAISDGNLQAFGTPQTVWITVLLFSLLAVLTAACVIPQRLPARVPGGEPRPIRINPARPWALPSMRPVTRRAVLGGLLATPLLAACAGFDTSGAAAPGTVGFLSTQFTPVEERQRFEQVLRSQLPVPVAYNPVEGGVFTTTIKSQAQARNVRTALIGGLYNDLAPLADAFDDVGGILRPSSRRAGYPDEILKLTTLGGTTPKFVPWMQATYIVAVNKQALQWLPRGRRRPRAHLRPVPRLGAGGAGGGGPPGVRHPGGPEGAVLPLHPGLPAAQLHRRAGHDVPRRRRRGRVDLHGASSGRPPRPRPPTTNTCRSRWPAARCWWRGTTSPGSSAPPRTSRTTG